MIINHIAQYCLINLLEPIIIKIYQSVTHWMLFIQT